MAYTVKKLALISGVSKRTLHFYDEIGLLSPAYVGENGYRYYEEEQLLTLQQILFYRELGFELKNIQSILEKSNFDKLKALKSHRKVLVAETKRLEKLLSTLDKTIKKLKGEYKMSANEIFEGFDLKKQKEHVDYLKSKIGENHPAFTESEKNVKGLQTDDWKKINADMTEIIEKFSVFLREGYSYDSKEVQQLVERHFQWVRQFWAPDKASYIGLGRLYIEHEDFRKYYDTYEPQLGGFLAEAMAIYAESHLK